MNYGVDRGLGIFAATEGRALSLRTAADLSLFRGIGGLDRDALTADTLNPILAAGRAAWTRLHERVEDAFRRAPRDLFVAVDGLNLRLPFEVADFVDFYSSIHHATNLGRLLRPGTEPLLPNWGHLPVSYHGRAGTVVVSGTPVHRPQGLVASDGGAPLYQPTARLDIELEVGVVVGSHTEFGQPMPIERAAAHVFGLVLLNDWSARDIQAYEYQLLGRISARASPRRSLHG